jgi:hypothetical protein
MNLAPRSVSAMLMVMTVAATAVAGGLSGQARQSASAERLHRLCCLHFF